MILDVPTISVYITNTSGYRQAILDKFEGCNYRKIANTPSPFSVTIPPDTDPALLLIDNIVEIWAGYNVGQLELDYIGLIRGIEYGTSAGTEYITIFGNSMLDILRRRIVNAYAGSSQADKTGPADNIIKAIVREQLGASAGTGRVINFAGGFVVESDQGAGYSITKAFSNRNVLTVCQDVASQSEANGKPIYFDIVGQESSDGKIYLVFKTWLNQPGSNYGNGSDSPIFVGSKWNNLEDVLLRIDHTDEINHVKALGSGEGILRHVVEVSDDDAIQISPINRCEGTVDCRNYEPGDDAGLTNEANATLEINKSRATLSGKLVETEDFRYLKHWRWGDIVSLSDKGFTGNALINDLSVSCNQNGIRSIEVNLKTNVVQE